MLLRVRYLCALTLMLFCLPLLASSDCAAIQSLAANDVQSGEPVTITWSYSGGEPLSQTLSGHDFAEPVVLEPGQTSYTYTPWLPGEKHLQLSATSSCGTAAKTIKYHVKRCNIVAPILTVSATTVDANATFTASLALPPGYTARWEVRNGTASATTGASVDVTAGTTGPVAVDAYVSRGSSCTVKVSASVNVQSACDIAEPQIYHSDRAVPNGGFTVYVPAVPGLTTTFSVTGAQVFYSDGEFLDVLAPATGSFSVDIIISNGTCSRTFTRTFEVTPCAPTATITAGTTDACGATSVVAELTGDGPFQGVWSDGEYFYTNDTRIERSVTTQGNYTIVWFYDNYCQGTVTGSVLAGSSLPVPAFTIDAIVEGGYYGTDTCPGLTRVARLDVAIPAGAEVVWSVENGTIVAGQGTAELQFAGESAGETRVTAVFREPQGCQSQPWTGSLQTQGTPEATITVEPSTISLGGTAVITLTRNEFVRSISIESSFGDTIAFLADIGNNQTQWEYRSSQQGGPATITVTVGNTCGVTTTASTTLYVDTGTPVGATATVRALGSNCSNYAVYAELTGVAPFSGTWSNGATFSDQYEPYWIFYPHEAGTYTLVAFSDANGPGTVTGSAMFDYVALPQPEIIVPQGAVCPNSIVTATLATPLPEGATAHWELYGGTIISGQGTAGIQIQMGEEYGVSMYVQVSAPNACSPASEWRDIYLSATQNPQFDLYGVTEGTSTTFLVYLDPNTVTWGFENSLGDTIELVQSPQPNVHELRYTSTHGVGTSNVRIYGTTSCGASFEATRVMQIVPPQPTATFTSTPREGCGADITVTFTGTAPFTATWWDTGETFTTNTNTHTRFVTQSGSYYLHSISDANRTDGIAIGSADVTVASVPYVSFGVEGSVCIGKTTTATAFNVPAGWEVIWTVDGTAARIVSGQGTPTVTIEGVEAGSFNLGARYRTPEGCEGAGSGYMLDVAPAASSPVFALPAESLKLGESLEFTVTLTSGQLNNFTWENSLGDPMWITSYDGQTFTFQYIAQNGTGPSTLRVSGTTMCGDPVEATATLNIVP